MLRPGHSAGARVMHTRIRLSSALVTQIDIDQDLPVLAFQILPVLSVDPAMMNSLSGDQARS